MIINYHAWHRVSWLLPLTFTPQLGHSYPFVVTAGGVLLWPLLCLVVLLLSKHRRTSLYLVSFSLLITMIFSRGQSETDYSLYSTLKNDSDVSLDTYEPGNIPKLSRFNPSLSVPMSEWKNKEIVRITPHAYLRGEAIYVSSKDDVPKLTSSQVLFSENKYFSETYGQLTGNPYLSGDIIDLVDEAARENKALGNEGPNSDRKKSLDKHVILLDPGNGSAGKNAYNHERFDYAGTLYSAIASSDDFNNISGEVVIVVDSNYDSENFNKLKSILPLALAHRGWILTDLHRREDYKMLVNKPMRISVLTGSEFLSLCQAGAQVVDISVRGHTNSLSQSNNGDKCGQPHSFSVTSVWHNHIYAEALAYAKENLDFDKPVIFTYHNKISGYLADVASDAINAAGYITPGIAEASDKEGSFSRTKVAAYIILMTGLNLVGMPMTMIIFSAIYLFSLLLYRDTNSRAQKIVAIAIAMTCACLMITGVTKFNAHCIFEWGMPALTLIAAAIPKRSKRYSKSQGLTDLRKLGFHVPRWEKIEKIPAAIPESWCGRIARSNGSDECSALKHSGTGKSFVIDDATSIEDLQAALTQFSTDDSPSLIIQDYIDGDSFGVMVINAHISGELGLRISLSTKARGATGGKSKTETLTLTLNEAATHSLAWIREAFRLAVTSQKPAVCEFSVKDENIFWIQYQPLNPPEYSIASIADTKNSTTLMQHGPITRSEVEALNKGLGANIFKAIGTNLVQTRHPAWAVWGSIASVLPSKFLFVLLRRLAQKPNDKIKLIQACRLNALSHFSHDYTLIEMQTPRELINKGFPEIFCMPAHQWVKEWSHAIRDEAARALHDTFSESPIEWVSLDGTLTNEEKGCLDTMILSAEHVAPDLIINNTDKVEEVISRVKRQGAVSILVPDQSEKWLSLCSHVSIILVPGDTSQDSHFCLQARARGARVMRFIN